MIKVSNKELDKIVEYYYMYNYRVISIIGNVGSGKNFITSKLIDIFSQTRSCVILAFAYYFKRVIHKEIYQYLSTNKLKTKHEYRLKLAGLYKRSVNKIDMKYVDKFIELLKEYKKFKNKEVLRKLYYLVGNDIKNDLKMYNIWNERMLYDISKIQEIESLPVIFVTDCRVNSEFELLNKFRTLFIFIDTPDEIRAKRRNISIEKLREIDLLPYEKNIKLLKNKCDIIIDNYFDLK